MDASSFGVAYPSPLLASSGLRAYVLRYRKWYCISTRCCRCVYHGKVYCKHPLSLSPIQKLYVDPRKVSSLIEAYHVRTTECGQISMIPNEHLNQSRLIKCKWASTSHCIFEAPLQLRKGLQWSELQKPLDLTALNKRNLNDNAPIRIITIFIINNQCFTMIDSNHNKLIYFKKWCFWGRRKESFGATAKGVSWAYPDTFPRKDGGQTNLMQHWWSLMSSLNFTKPFFATWHWVKMS